VLDIVKKFDKVEASKVSASSHFNQDLGLDSLDTVELVLALEEEFAVEIPDDAADKITSVPDAVKYFATHPHAK
jgi:NADH dehydrogenase (ubiquinone) 1 alpha/beta subcomplex 1, acyl-carrier protein